MVQGNNVNIFCFCNNMNGRVANSGLLLWKGQYNCVSSKRNRISICQARAQVLPPLNSFQVQYPNYFIIITFATHITQESSLYLNNWPWLTLSGSWSFMIGQNSSERAWHYWGQTCDYIEAKTVNIILFRWTKSRNIALGIIPFFWFP